MQTTRKLAFSLKRGSDRLWTYFLLFYSAVIFILPVFGIQISMFLMLPFFLFVPGYSFVAVVFPKLPKLERVVVSIGASIALIAGINSLIKTIAMPGLFSELAVLAIISMVCLTVKLIK